MSITIAFEGIDESGKTTQAHILSRKLAFEDISSVVTCEPTGGMLGDQLSRGLWGTSNILQLVLLYAADRCEPAPLEHSTCDLLIKDRSWISSIAYQANKLCRWGLTEDPSNPNMEGFVFQCNQHCMDKDPWFLFDIDPEVAADRQGVALGVLDIYTLNAVREKYLEVASRPEDHPLYVGPCTVIDADQSVEAVSMCIKERVIDIMDFIHNGGT